MEFKLRGYYKMPRQLVLDMLNKKITLGQFALLNVYISTADWDKRHRHSKYAISKFSNNKIGTIIGINKDKVSREKQILNIKRYIKLIKGKNNQEYVKIIDPKKYFSDIASKSNDTVSKIRDT